MLTLDQVKHRLEHMNLKRVAKEAGVHYNALYRMMNGSVSPRYETVKKVSDWIEGRQ